MPIVILVTITDTGEAVEVSMNGKYIKPTHMEQKRLNEIKQALDIVLGERETDRENN